MKRGKKIGLLGSGQQMPDPDEQGDRAQSQERQGESEAILKPIGKSLITP
jgi:hypothetical protein